MKNTSVKLADLEAFSPLCPLPEDVTSTLQALGFTLDFQMDATRFPKRGDASTPALPAQYHYSDRYGTEVIYLAGRDSNTDGIRLPEHASRFWVFPGGNIEAYRQIVSDLVVRWRLAWFSVDRSTQSLAQRDVA